jgi:hypothetical protein
MRSPQQFVLPATIAASSAQIVSRDNVVTMHCFQS